MASESNESKDWTIMVYMAGDNNLGVDMAYALKDIREVAKAGDKVNLMVYYDGSSPDAPTLYCDFSDFKDPKYVPAFTVESRYKGRSRSSEQNPQNQNAATTDSIMNFVDWCVNPKKQGKKADKYALIFSGHGFGFQSISFLKDDTSDDCMTIKKFRTSLEKIRDEILGQPIDLIGLDCCVMGMLEIGYEIRKCARTMIASEGSIPNAGWTYGNILGELVSSSSTQDTAQVAKRFVYAFVDSQKEFAVGGVSVDLSAWDLAKIENVVSATNKLGELLLMGLLKESDIYQPLRGALIQSHWDCQSYMFEQNVDLKDFCERLLDSTKNLMSDESVILMSEGEGKFVEMLKERCNQVIDAVETAVLECGFSGGAYQFSNGIAVFFPWTFQTYVSSEKSYAGLKFANNGGAYWNAFLLHFLKDVTLRGQNSRSGQQNSILDFPTKGDKTMVRKATGQIINNPAFRIIEDERKRITANPANQILTKPANRSVANPAHKLYNYPADKVIENGSDRIAENPVFRIAENPAFRMLGTTEAALSNFKNVVLPWDIFGYSKVGSDTLLEKSEAAWSGG